MSKVIEINGLPEIVFHGIKDIEECTELVLQIFLLNLFDMELIIAFNYDRALHRERVCRDHLEHWNTSDEHLLRYYRIINLIDKLE